MGREWSIWGPDEDMLSVRAVAKLFGYEERTWRAMIADGLAPSPRGVGQSLFYTSEDVACIRLMLGRWRPAAAPPKQPKGKAEEGDEQ